MNLHIRQLAIVLVFTMAAFINPKQSSAQSNEVGFQVFYDALSPYGQWVDYQDYGYVWIPDVGEDFTPYSTNGYWILTDFGWTWVSDYEWGWAPFHYGRWDYDNYYGWLWVPDNEWGPSWVNWRMADGYYGWCPMEPGISITIGFNTPYNDYNDHWMFVRGSDFERRDINRYTIDRSRNSVIIQNSTIINKVFIDNSRHTTYVTGPARADVQRTSGHEIRPVAIRENSRPGKDQNDGNLRMYRPEVNRNSRSERNAAPNRVEKLQDVKRPSERNSNWSQPAPQQQRTNPTFNKEKQQINNGQPVRQPEQSTPIRNNERQQQNSNKATQPSQQQKEVPTGNNSRQQQQQKPQQQQRQQQQQQQKQQQQQSAPERKNERQQQQQQQRQQQQSAPERNSERQQQQQQRQQQQSAPQRNNERQQQQNNRVQPPQQSQQAAPTNAAKQQENPAKKQNQKAREQKAPDATDDKKQNK